MNLCGDGEGERRFEEGNLVVLVGVALVEESAQLAAASQGIGISVSTKETRNGDGGDAGLEVELAATETGAFDLDVLTIGGASGLEVPGGLDGSGGSHLHAAEGCWSLGFGGSLGGICAGGDADCGGGGGNSVVINCVNAH